MTNPAAGPIEAPRRILVTNDDGIDSIGLGVLARAMRRFGQVTVVCPASEHSGAGAALGPLHAADPEVGRVEIDGIDEAWTVDGPPALCVFYARMNAFGFLPDLIVSGINPGANVGPSVYHSGTIGAVLTGRSGMIPGIAVSQAFAEPVEDTDEARRDYDGRVSRQRWDTAAAVAAEVVDGMLATEFDDCAVINLNVPNLPLAEIKGWQWTEVGLRPPWSVDDAQLVPIDGRPGRFRVEQHWVQSGDQPEGSDGAALQADNVSVAVLCRLQAAPVSAPEIDRRLDTVVGRNN